MFDGPMGLGPSFIICFQCMKRDAVSIHFQGGKSMGTTVTAAFKTLVMLIQNYSL
jgi:hypothetical protein